MFGFLKQSTAAQSRSVGPFVDDTDFKTLETALTIVNTDVKLSKNGAAGVNKNSGGGTHRNNGMYSLTFDATDSNSVGELGGSISVAGALVVVFKFWVLEEASYDAIFGAGAGGFDANGRIDVGSWLGTAAATPTVAGVPEVDVTHVGGGTTLPELPQAAPPATPTLAEAVMLHYMTARNKLDIDKTAGTKELHNDAGTVIAKKNITDDGTTYSEAEMISGP